MVPTALQWLAAVNGTCGIEYELLKKDAQSLTSDSWNKLDARTRERLQHWCQFKPREAFLVYFNDPDFPHSDAGLAGVVLTDQRLIYHKYRHSRSLSLHQDGLLHVRTDGKVARLTAESGGRMARCGKLDIKAVPDLVHTLATSSRLRVNVGRS